MVSADTTSGAVAVNRKARVGTVVSDKGDQTIIVAIVAGGLAALHRRLPGSERRTVMIGSILVILAGAWWFFERVFLTT